MNRQTLSLIGILILVLALAAPSFAVFTDDFEDPAWTAANWWSAGQKIAVVSQEGGGVLQCKGGEMSVGAAIADRGRSYQVDGLTFGADVCILPGSNGGLVWGFQGMGSVHYADYSLCLDPARDGIWLDEDVPDGPVKHYSLGEAVIPGIEFNTWYRLEVVSTDTNFEIWFAPRGEALAKVIDVAQDALHPGWQAYDGGLVGVWGERLWPDSRSFTLQFDNVSVTAPPDSVRRLACPIVRALREEPALVPVWLGEAEGLAGAQFDLYYDPSLFTGLIGPGVEKGALIAADPDWSLVSHPVAPGHLRIMAYNTSSVPLPVGAAGEVARLTFSVNPAAAAGTFAHINLEGVTLADRLGQALLSAPCDGAAYVARAAEWFEFDPIADPQAVGNPFTVTLRAKDEFGDPGVLFNGGANLSDLTGTMTPTYVTFTEGLATWSATIGAAHAADEIRAADALDSAVVGTSNPFQVLAISDPNGDGETNVLDVLLAVNYALETLEPTPAQLAAADPNHDGAVNVLDVILIQNLALGITGSPLPERTASLQAVQMGRKAVHGAKTVAIPILVDDAAGLAGAQLSLTYDASAYTPVEVRAGDLLAGKNDWIVSANLSGTPAKVLCFNSSAAPLPAGKGTLVEVIFAQTGKAPKPAVSLQAAVCGDGAGGSIVRGLSAGKARPVR